MASHDPEPRGWASQLRGEVAGLIAKYTEIGLTPVEVAKDVIDVVIQRYTGMLADEGYYTAKTKTPWPEEILSDADIERMRAGLRSYDPDRVINERKQQAERRAVMAERPQLRSVGEK